MDKLPKIEATSKPLDFACILENENETENEKLPVINSPQSGSKKSPFSGYFRQKDRSRVFQKHIAKYEMRPIFVGDDSESDTRLSTGSYNQPCTTLSSSSNSKSRKKLGLERSVSFDYAELHNETDFTSRLAGRRRAICPKLKSTDALQLETFIVVSRLKNFDLLWIKDSQASTI